MTYQYARINLLVTDYSESVTWQYLDKTEHNIDRCLGLYRDYCVYKKFESVMPLFRSEFLDHNNDLIGYYDDHSLVAFSMIRRYDSENAECVQFAWNYHRPKMRLGIESLKTECAIYRERGFKYLYLDRAHSYKHEFVGFEILGPLT